MIYKYNDSSEVRNDVKILNEILSRQGCDFLIDVIAEYAGNRASEFNLCDSDRSRLLNSLLGSMKSALGERL